MEFVPTELAQALKEPVPLAELAERARASAKTHEDHPDVSFGHLRMRPDGTLMFEGEVGKFSRHAFAQLCARLDLPGGGTVPSGYLARCPGELAAGHVNHWLSRPERAEQKVLIRACKDGRRRRLHLRAVLSDRYATVDHLPLLQTLQGLVPKSGLALQAWSLDDEQLTLRLLYRGDHPASLQDPLRVGLHVSNSEVGLGRISITPLITRLVCTNGLVVRVAELGGIHRRHVGKTGERLEAMVHAALPQVLEEADEACRRFVRLRETPAPAPVEEFLKQTAREAELPETAVPLALHVLEGETLYDVINAYTRAAQRFPVAERVRIETAMSRFLQDKRNWS